jgi:hypothetical protein
MDGSLRLETILKCIVHRCRFDNGKSLFYSCTFAATIMLVNQQYTHLVNYTHNSRVLGECSC